MKSTTIIPNSTTYTPVQKRMYSVSEIQNILSISRPTAYTLVKKKLFRSIRIGGKIHISKKSFDEWLDLGYGGATNE